MTLPTALGERWRTPANRKRARFIGRVCLMTTIVRSLINKLTPNRRVSRLAKFVVGLLCVLPSGAHAEGAAGTTRAQSSINFRIVIPALVRVSATVHPLEITIRPSDIAQGYVDLENASLVTVTSNNREGFLLSARYDTSLFSRVEIRVGSQRAPAASGFGSMLVQSRILQEATLAVGYRLYINSGIAPGRYAWPIALAFSTLAV